MKACKCAWRVGLLAVGGLLDLVDLFWLDRQPAAGLENGPNLGPKLGLWASAWVTFVAYNWAL